MNRLLTDEDFNGRITRGLLAQQPTLDLVRAQDVGLSGVADPLVLEWAAQTGRVLLTHDVRTMAPFARTRIKGGLSMPGIVVVVRSIAIGRAIDELLLMIGASLEGEWTDQIRYISE